MAYATASAHAIDNFMDDIETNDLATAVNRLCAAVNQAYDRAHDVDAHNTVVGMVKFLHTLHDPSRIPNDYTRVQKSVRDRIGNGTGRAGAVLALFDKINNEITNENIAEEKRAKNMVELASQRAKEISETEKRAREDANAAKLISSLPQLAAEVPQVEKIPDADPFAPQPFAPMTNVKHLPCVSQSAPVQLTIKEVVEQPGGTNNTSTGTKALVTEAFKQMIRNVAGEQSIPSNALKPEEPKPQVPHLGDTNILHTNLDSVPAAAQVAPPPLPAEMCPLEVSPAQIHHDTRNLLANVPHDLLPSLLVGNMLRLSKADDIAVGLRIIFQKDKLICQETQFVAIRRILSAPASDARAKLLDAWTSAMRTLPAY